MQLLILLPCECNSKLQFSCLWSIITQYGGLRQLLHFGYLHTHARTHTLTHILSLCLTCITSSPCRISFFFCRDKKKMTPLRVWLLQTKQSNNFWLFIESNPSRLELWYLKMFIIKVLVYLNRALLRCRDYYKVEKTCHFSGLGGVQAAQKSTQLLVRKLKPSQLTLWQKKSAKLAWFVPPCSYVWDDKWTKCLDYNI